MIYFMKNNIVIRRMQDTDPQIFSNEECAQGWGMLRPKNMICAFQMKKGISVAIYSRISESSCWLI